MSTARVTRRTWPRLVLFGVPLYIVFLVASAPASVAGWLIARASEGVATLEQPAGGLWHGRAAALVVTAPGASRQRFANVAWRVSAPRLLRGQLAVQVSADGSAAKGTGLVVFRPRSVGFSELTVTSPAATVGALFPLLQLAGVGGRIEARANDLVIGQGELRGSADIQWIEATTTLSPVSPLGTYRARVQGEGDTAGINVSTEQGALQIVGTGAWSAAQGLQFSGEARATLPQVAALQPLLKLFGPPDSRGAHLLRYSLPPSR